VREGLIAGGLLVALATVLLALPKALRRFARLYGESRGISHFLTGALVSLGVYLIDSRWVMIIAGVVGVIFIVIGVERGLLGSMLTGSRLRDYGFVAYGVGFVVVVAACMPNRLAVIAGLMTLAAADPVASAIGRRMGRHSIRAWRSERTLEGSLAFVVVAFSVSLIALGASGQPLLPNAGFALFVASTAAVIELIMPSMLDNFAIPLWVGFLYLLGGHGQAAPGLPWLTAVTIGAASAALCVRLRWLDPSAAVASFFVTASALALGGWPWLAPMVVFLGSTSVITKLRASDSERGPRGLQQTAVNGIAPTLPVLAYVLTGGMLWYFLYIGAVAVANADTWASEVGRLFGHSTPVSLRNLRRVEKGTSGAVTWVGTAASLVGGALIGATAAAVAPGNDGLRLFVVGVVVGPLGMIIDSALGAWVQCRYRCSVCEGVYEVSPHCGQTAQVIAGIPGLTNDFVNLAANCVGALLALQMSLVIGS
jgi:uncharacterized protein (TIGR00297 family)